MADSGQLSLGGSFKSNNAAIELIQAEPASQIQIDSGASTEWKATIFKGDGQVRFASGAIVKEVAGCTIEKSIRLSFDDLNKTVVQQWRNNDWQQPSVDLNSASTDVRAWQCDGSGTGERSGCDRRATCQNAPSGGVQCACNGLVDEAAGSTENGTVCVQRAHSDAFFKQTRASVIVRKPMNATLPIYFAVQGEEQASTTVKSTAEYIVIDPPTAVLQLSAARPQLDGSFVMTILGSNLNWADSFENNAAQLTLETVRQHQSGPDVQSLSISVDMKPYPSCVHTQASVPKSLKHTDGRLGLRLDARDVHNLPITRTEFEYQLAIQYYGKIITDFTCKGGNGNGTICWVQLPPSILGRQGEYVVYVTLLQGWDHEQSKSVDCKISTQLLNVVCAPGSVAGADKTCMERDADAMCRAANILLDGHHLGRAADRTAHRAIGTSSMLNVTIDDRDARNYTLRLMDLQNKREASFEMQTATMVMAETGHFALQLLHQNRTPCMKCALY